MAAQAVDVSVITSGHDVADARLHREVAALRAEGLRIEVLGLGATADAPDGCRARTWPRVGGPGRALLAGRMARAAEGRILVSLDPDSALAAGAIRWSPGGRRAGRRLVVDVHEDYAALLRDRAWARGPRGWLAQGLVSAFLAVAGRADLTAVADEHVPPLRARNRLVVRNEPDLALLPGPGPTEDRPRAVYIGDLRSSRGLFAMVEAVRRSDEWLLDLIGPVAPDDRDHLSRTLAGGAWAERVRLHDRMPPRAAWQRAGGAWAGLLLLQDTPAFRQAQPSKLAEYLACGLPVISTDLPRPAGVIRQSGAGRVVDGQGDWRAVGARVAEVLRAWSGDPASYWQVRRAALGLADGARRSPTGYQELARGVSGLW